MYVVPDQLEEELDQLEQCNIEVGVLDHNVVKLQQCRSGGSA